MKIARIERMYICVYLGEMNMENLIDFVKYSLEDSEYVLNSLKHETCNMRIIFTNYGYYLLSYIGGKEDNDPIFAIYGMYKFRYFWKAIYAWLLAKIYK